MLWDIFCFTECINHQIKLICKQNENKLDRVTVDKTCMLLIYFSIFSQSCLKEDFWLLSYIGGFKPQNSKLNMAVHHKQMLVRHGCVFWLWDNLDKYKVNHDLSWEKDVWTKSIVKTPYVCIIQPRSIAGLHHYTQQPISGIGKKWFKKCSCLHCIVGARIANYQTNLK